MDYTESDKINNTQEEQSSFLNLAPGLEESKVAVNSSAAPSLKGETPTVEAKSAMTPAGGGNPTVEAKSATASSAGGGKPKGKKKSSVVSSTEGAQASAAHSTRGPAGHEDNPMFEVAVPQYDPPALGYTRNTFVFPADALFHLPDQLKGGVTIDNKGNFMYWICSCTSECGEKLYSIDDALKHLKTRAALCKVGCSTDRPFTKGCNKVIPFGNEYARNHLLHCHPKEALELASQFSEHDITSDDEIRRILSTLLLKYDFKGNKWTGTKWEDRTRNPPALARTETSSISREYLVAEISGESEDTTPSQNAPWSTAVKGKRKGKKQSHAPECATSHVAMSPDVSTVDQSVDDVVEVTEPSVAPLPSPESLATSVVKKKKTRVVPELPSIVESVVESVVPELISVAIATVPPLPIMEVGESATVFQPRKQPRTLFATTVIRLEKLCKDSELGCTHNTDTGHVCPFNHKICITQLNPGDVIPKSLCRYGTCCNNLECVFNHPSGRVRWMIKQIRRGEAVLPVAPVASVAPVAPIAQPMSKYDQLQLILNGNLDPELKKAAATAYFSTSN